MSYSSTSSLSSISSFRCAFTSSSYHFLHPTRSSQPPPTHHSLPHRPQYSVSQWVSVSRLRVFNMVSCTKGAKYALCALHDNGAGIRCRLQVASCSCSMQATFQLSSLVARRCSWTASKLPPLGAVSALKPTKSFQSRHSKLSPRLIALLRTTAAATNWRGRSGRSVLSVAQWRHVSLGQGIKIIANSPVPSSPWAAACKCQSQKVKVPSHRQQQKDAPEKCNKHSKYAKKDSTKRGNQAIRLRQSKKKTFKLYY